MLPRLILIGLGNPGSRYHATRHNVGFRVVDRLAATHGAEWRRPRLSYESAEIDLGDFSILLAKPFTYMNLSGEAVGDLRAAGPIDPAGMLVVTDDVAIPLGSLRLRRKGHHGGHNGLRSIIEVLQTTGFLRLRLGVGPVPDSVDIADFVLSDFPESEESEVGTMIDRAVECVHDLVNVGIEKAMSRHNTGPANGETV